MGMSYAYLIETDTGLILVDTGLVGREAVVIDKMAQLGRDDLRLIYLTHAHLDHSGSAAALQQLTGAPIIIHAEDAPALRAGTTNLGQPNGFGVLIKPILPLVEMVIGPPPCHPDVTVYDGYSLKAYDVAAVVLHTPGHTAGSTTLLVDGTHAFVGDLITTENPIPRLQRNYATDWPALRPSLNRLIATAPAWVYPGHGDYIPVPGSSLAKIVT